MKETFEIGSTHALGDEKVRVEVRVPLRSVYFEGHFEGRPMLPGVAQVVGLGHAEAQRCYGPLGPARRLIRTKFQAVVVPGDALDLFFEIERGEETKVRFRLMRGEESVSSGTLVYAA